MKRRQFTDEQKAGILSFYSTHGHTKTLRKFGIHSSVLHGMRQRAGVGAHRKSREARTAVSAPRGHSALALLTQAQNTALADLRTGRIQRLDRAHLLAMLALLELTEVTA